MTTGTAAFNGDIFLFLPFSYRAEVINKYCTIHIHGLGRKENFRLHSAQKINDNVFLFNLGKGGVTNGDVEGSVFAQKAGGAADFVRRRQNPIAFGVAQGEVAAAAAAVPRQLNVIEGRENRQRISSLLVVDGGWGGGGTKIVVKADVVDGQRDGAQLRREEERGNENRFRAAALQWRRRRRRPRFGGRSVDVDVDAVMTRGRGDRMRRTGASFCVEYRVSGLHSFFFYLFLAF